MSDMEGERGFRDPLIESHQVTYCLEEKVETHLNKG
jgi:hypothetical protein